MTAMVVYICYCLLRPLSIAISPVDLTSPAAGKFTAADVTVRRGAVGYLNPLSGQPECRPLGSGSEYDQAKPTASLAKLITVQVVLDKHPLKAGETGPTITMSADDEAHYWEVVRNGGGYGRVVAGEQITERQLIEGIVLASANNMADSLAKWAFGSMDNYHQAARQWLASHNLTSTSVGGDASGFDPQTKSTPTDLCRVMLLATKQPALVEIMQEREAVMPTGDVMTSTNRLLGQNGIFAGKTGYTEEAGRGFMLASQQTINGTVLTTAAVSLGNDSYTAAFDTAGQLNDALSSSLRIYHLDQDRAVGQIKSRWGSRSDVVVANPLTIPYWADQAPTINLTMSNDGQASLSANSIVGQLQIGDNSVNLITKQTIKAPSLGWRLSHPF